jgi:hypothetical protein
MSREIVSQTRLPPALVHKERFAYEWLLAYRADTVPGLVRGRCRYLGLGRRLGHDADGGTRGQALWGSLDMRSTIMGGMLRSTRGCSMVLGACCDAVAGPVVRGVKQTIHDMRAVMPRILCTTGPVATQGQTRSAQLPGALVPGRPLPRHATRGGW